MSSLTLLLPTSTPFLWSKFKIALTRRQQIHRVSCFGRKLRITLLTSNFTYVNLVSVCQNVVRSQKVEMVREVFEGSEECVGGFWEGIDMV